MNFIIMLLGLFLMAPIFSYLVCENVGPKIKESYNCDAKDLVYEKNEVKYFLSKIDPNSEAKQTQYLLFTGPVGRSPGEDLSVVGPSYPPYPTSIFTDKETFVSEDKKEAAKLFSTELNFVSFAKFTKAETAFDPNASFLELLTVLKAFKKDKNGTLPSLEMQNILYAPVERKFAFVSSASETEVTVLQADTGIVKTTEPPKEESGEKDGKKIEIDIKKEEAVPKTQEETAKNPSDTKPQTEEKKAEIKPGVPDKFLRELEKTYERLISAVNEDKRSTVQEIRDWADNSRKANQEMLKAQTPETFDLEKIAERFEYDTQHYEELLKDKEQVEDVNLNKKSWFTEHWALLACAALLFVLAIGVALYFFFRGKEEDVPISRNKNDTIIAL